MGDGHLNKCKTCTKSDTIKNRSSNLNYYLHYDRNRPNKEQRAKEMNEYRKTDQGKIVAKTSHRNYISKYPKKRSAVIKVSNAIRDGKLIRPDSCSSCGNKCIPHGHHCDYNKPLDVLWFCNECHVQWHLHNVAINGE